MLAAMFYSFPSGKLIVIGVTGTTGKTSTVYLIAKMLEQADYKVGFTSTSVFSDGDKEWLNDRKMTMPGRFFIQKSLRKMVKNNCHYAIVETTSEGIKQFRHRFVNYDTVIFTGLYPEHIESHGSFENYKKTKGKLFSYLRTCSTKYVDDGRIVRPPKSGLEKLNLNRVRKTIIVNGDDAEAEYFLKFWSESKVIYSTNPEASSDKFWQKFNLDVRDLRIVQGGNIAAGSKGVDVVINNKEINLKLLGEFNALNALTAYSVGLDQGIEEEVVKAGLESVSGLAGKLESIDVGQDFLAIVDYSFEPRALEKLYKTIDLIPHKRLIHVLGSTGGGRDKARRPILGEMAGKQVDIVIVANEDPYDEDPMIIIEQVAIGAEKGGKVIDKDLFKVLDRREAIKKAVKLAEEGDLVLFTGKGSEQHICLANGEKMLWDEREEVKKAILELTSE